MRFRSLRHLAKDPGPLATTERSVQLELIPIPLALGLFLTLAGLVGVGFGIYALVWGGRGQHGGGLGPIPERGIHAIAGLRMLAGGVIALVFGILSYFSA